MIRNGHSQNLFGFYMIKAFSIASQKLLFIKNQQNHSTIKDSHAVFIVPILRDVTNYPWEHIFSEKFKVKNNSISVILFCLHSLWVCLGKGNLSCFFGMFWYKSSFVNIGIWGKELDLSSKLK